MKLSMRDKGNPQILLFTPADDERKMRKHLDEEPDAVVLDLEDAVDEANKDTAREFLSKQLEDMVAESDSHTLVRINDLDSGRAFRDLDAIVCAGLFGVVAPKISSPSDLACLDRYLDTLERERNIRPNSVRLVATVETAAGIESASRLARSAPPRLWTLGFGPGDLARDLGLQFATGEADLSYARAQLPIVCRAAGLAPPLDGPHLKLNDSTALRDDTLTSHRLGFAGRFAIHPEQIGTIREALEPDADGVAFARIAISAFEEATKAGKASILVDDTLVDIAIYEAAKVSLENISGQRRKDS